MVSFVTAREATSALTGEFHRSRTSDENQSLTVEIGGWASRATLDIIGVAGMGKDFNSLQNPQNELTQAYQRVFDPGKVGRILQLMGIFLPLWFLRRIPVQRNTDIREAAATIKRTCLSLVQDKRRRLEKGARTDYDILSVAIESGGFSDEDLPVPRGTTIIMSPWAINQSKKLWGPDARSFNPDRWIDSTTGHANNTGGADSNFSFLTFLHGPRSCIGQAFAKAEFACLLAAWVGSFEMELAEPDKEIDIKSGITARPKGGLMVKLKPIGGW
ncbi:MAG: hypothetical protein Q9165_006518 [Trypethelium subeluteriae]